MTFAGESVSGVGQLPFGRGWNILIGGWQHNWIGTIPSGLPIGRPGNVYLLKEIAINGHIDQQSFQLHRKHQRAVPLRDVNAFNTPIRTGPITHASNSNFGLVPIGQNNITRQIQLGFKFNF